MGRRLAERDQRRCSGNVEILIDVGHAYSVVGMKRLVKKFIRYAHEFNEGRDPAKLKSFFDNSRETA